MLRNIRNNLSTRYEKGATVVEAAIVLPLFILIIFFLIGYSRSMFLRSMLDEGLYRAGKANCDCSKY